MKPCCEKMRDEYRKWWKSYQPSKPKPTSQVALLCTTCKQRIVWAPDNPTWRNEVA